MISEADQTALRARAIALIAVFLKESDPDSWPDSDTKEGRGNLVWLKKSAVQTLVIVQMIRQLLTLPANEEAHDDQEAMIAEAEAMAKKILGRAAPH